MIFAFCLFKVTLAYGNVGTGIYLDLIRDLAERFRSKKMFEEAIRCYDEGIVSSEIFLITTVMKIRRFVPYKIDKCFVFRNKILPSFLTIRTEENVI